MKSRVKMGGNTLIVPREMQHISETFAFALLNCDADLMRTLINLPQ